MALISTQVCKVCETQQSKYKCSTCYIPYCSLQCYKTHKEIPCKKPTESTTSPATDSKVEVNRTTIPFDEGNQNGPKKDIITEKDDEYEESRLYNHQLRRLAESPTIKSLLQSSSLRSHLIRIDRSDDPEKELSQLLTNLNPSIMDSNAQNSGLLSHGNGSFEGSEDAAEFTRFADECLRIVRG